MIGGFKTRKLRCAVSALLACVFVFAMIPVSGFADPDPDPSASASVASSTTSQEANSPAGDAADAATEENAPSAEDPASAGETLTASASIGSVSEDTQAEASGSAVASTVEASSNTTQTASGEDASIEPMASTPTTGLAVTKTVVDANGNVIADDDTYFYFDIAITYSTFRRAYPNKLLTVQIGDNEPGTLPTDSSGVLRLKVPAGQTAYISKPDGNSAYYYSITELKTDGYDQKSSSNASGTITNTSLTTATFTNTKTSSSPTVDITATKTLDGAAPGGNTFTFDLYKGTISDVKAGTATLVQQGARNDSSGNISFDTFDAPSTPGTYTYTVVERQDRQEGIVYDSNGAYEVAVTVASSNGTNETLSMLESSTQLKGDFDSSGGAEITVSYTDSNGVSQTQTIPTYCIQNGVMAAGYYDKTIDPKTRELESYVKGGRNSADNKYVTDYDIKDVLSKLLYYFSNSKNATVGSVGTGSEHTNQTYTLNSNTKNQLIWCATGGEVAYQSTYSGYIDWILDCYDKGLTEPVPDDFTLVLFSGNGTGASGDQQAMVAGYVMDSELTATVGNVPTFANTTEGASETYTADISATKTLDGAAPGEGNVFSFTLYDAQGSALETKSNDATGSVSFSRLMYSEPGTYDYTIREVSDASNAQMRYDGTEVLVRVVATAGTTAAEVTYSTDGGNTYTATAPTFNNRTLGSLEVSKSLVDSSGAATTDATTSFSFTATLVNADDTPYAGSYTLTKTDASGTEGASESLTTSDGVVTFSLKGGEKVVLGGLPVGTKYAVIEGQTPSYYSLKSVNGTQGATQAEGSIAASGPQQAAFVNEYTFVVPTGVVVEWTPYVCVLLAGAAFVFARTAMKLSRRRRAAVTAVTAVTAGNPPYRSRSTSHFRSRSTCSNGDRKRAGRFFRSRSTCSNGERKRVGSVGTSPTPATMGSRETPAAAAAQPSKSRERK